MLKRMNSKSIQNTWCYRYKLLSLWISTIDILGFFYIHCILKMCFKNTLVQGWGGGKAKAYFWVQGWVGSKNSHFGAYVLYGWPPMLNPSFFHWTKRIKFNSLTSLDLLQMINWWKLALDSALFHCARPHSVLQLMLFGNEIEIVGLLVGWSGAINWPYIWLRLAFDTPESLGLLFML